jgi:REP element-mobilizing transposase RayT
MVVPGTTYMLTRRCTQRRFLLRPDKHTVNAFCYCLALTAQRHGIEVHACSVMSNHYHLGIRDVRGVLPEFLRDFHSLLGRCLNAYLHRWENFWASEQSSAVVLADAEAVLDKMLYGLTNPVKDHLVERVHHWPGLNSLGYQLTGRQMKARRPHWFFNRGSRLPKSVSLKLVRPRGFEHLSDQQWRQRLRDETAKREQKFATTRRQHGIPLVGRKAVRRQSPFSSPRTLTQRRGLKPRIATRNKWLRLERTRRHKRFEHEYRAALGLYAAGQRDIPFPYGTYKMRVEHAVRCHPPPA